MRFVVFIKRYGFVGLAVALLLMGNGLRDANAEETTDWAASVQLAETPDGDDVNDPLEPLNRIIFEFNEALQAMFLRPLSEFYEGLTPPPIREGIGNMLDNINTPVVLINDILQGEGQRAMETTQRFLINTTYGVGGFVDRAEEMGITAHDEDFGQTLAVWGVGEGFYLVLPIFGPSNPRDAIGELFVDSYFDLIGDYLIDENGVSNARMILGGLDEYSSVMSELEQIKKTSIDYYAAIRSMYRQKRSAEIGNGEELDLPPIPDLSSDLNDDGFGSVAISPN